MDRHDFGVSPAPAELVIRDPRSGSERRLAFDPDRVAVGTPRPPKPSTRLDSSKGPLRWEVVDAASPRAESGAPRRPVYATPSGTRPHVATGRVRVVLAGGAESAALRDMLASADVGRASVGIRGPRADCVLEPPASDPLYVLARLPAIRALPSVRTAAPELVTASRRR